jgi:hypothetical protein
MNGIDYWTNGTPPRKYRVLGTLTDKRRMSGLTPDVAGSSSVAKATKAAGGDAVIITSQREQSIGPLVSDEVTTLTVVKYED